MKMMKNRLARRTFLRGGVGAAMALPVLDIMLNGNGTAYAAGGPIPIRYGTFFWGNGVRPDQWRLDGEGPEWWRSPSEELAPIAASALVRDQVSVLSGFDCGQGGTAHHTGRAQMMTGTYDSNRGTYGGPTGPSSDYIVADAWEGQTLLRSMDVGISTVGKSFSTVGGHTSVDGGGSFVRPEFSPTRMFERLFVGIDTAEVPGASLAPVRQSVVDVVREDAARLRTRLGMNDQRRLDAHLEGLRGIERQLGAIDSVRCVAPAEPGDHYNDDKNHELLEEKNQVVAEMLAMALACDVTRVFSYQYTGMQSDCLFWQVGASQGSHVLTHDDRGTGDPLDPQYERVHQVVTFIMQNFTTMLEALARMPEGEHNVLHNTVIYATTELQDGTRHNYSDMPILVAGRAGGALRSGLHHRGGGANTSQVPLTCMRAAGIEIDGFGSGASRATSDVSALYT